MDGRILSCIGHHTQRSDCNRHRIRTKRHCARSIPTRSRAEMVSKEEHELVNIVPFYIIRAFIVITTAVVFHLQCTPCRDQQLKLLDRRIACNLLIIIGRVHKYIISINSNITSTGNIVWRMVAGHQEVMPRCIGKYRMGGTRSQKWDGVKVFDGVASRTDYRAL